MTTARRGKGHARPNGLQHLSAAPGNEHPRGQGIPKGTKITDSGHDVTQSGEQAAGGDDGVRREPMGAWAGPYGLGDNEDGAAGAEDEDGGAAPGGSRDRGRAGGRARRRSPPSRPWGGGQTIDPYLLASKEGPSVQCALLMLCAALGDRHDVLASSLDQGCVAVIKVPDGEWGPELMRAWSLSRLAAAHARRLPPDRKAWRDPSSLKAEHAERQAQADCEYVAQLEVLSGAGRLKEVTAAAADAIRRGRPVHAFAQDPEAELPPSLVLAEDLRVSVAPPSAAVLASLATALADDGGWPTARVPKMPPGLAAEAGTVTPALVNLARRPGQTPAEFLARLAHLVARRDALARRLQNGRAAHLDDLPGLGEAGEWGQRAALDLRALVEGRLAWSEVDRGVVLEGPPGCGKSSFAKALANTAGVPLIAASLAQWQGNRDGHLGHLLGAMQQTFAEARKRAPCVLLLDEIDSFPTRSTVRHDHRDYVVEVVNGLLEQLDGPVERVGVLVIGTCNDASGLDPALTRSGRLERVVRLSRPDAPALQAILRVHLAGALAASDLGPVAAAAARSGAVGADVERWCREARRRARMAGREMLLEDLMAELGEPPRSWNERTRWTMAVHEAGHVAACAAADPSMLGGAVLSPDAAGVTAVRIEAAADADPVLTLDFATKQLRAALAGRAAEEVILGVPSGGAGGGNGSDLAIATRLACAIVTSSGLDRHEEGLVFLCPVGDLRRSEDLLLMPDIRQRVAALLRDAYGEALVLVRDSRAGIERVAEELAREGDLTAERCFALLGSLNLPHREPCPAEPGSAHHQPEVP